MIWEVLRPIITLGLVCITVAAVIVVTVGIRNLPKE